jgi:CheY-like chemotaxis protein
MSVETADDAHDIESPKTVLVVEDEILIRWVTSEHLRECGYRVVEAGSGDDAIEVMRRSAFAINVVFSDVMMPGSIDGFALAQWVRKHRPDIRVLLTSGIAKGVAAADAPYVEVPVVPKPYSTIELERRIKKLLAQ